MNFETNLIKTICLLQQRVILKRLKGNCGKFLTRHLWNETPIITFQFNYFWTFQDSPRLHQSSSFIELRVHSKFHFAGNSTDCSYKVFSKLILKIVIENCTKDTYENSIIESQNMIVNFVISLIPNMLVFKKVACETYTYLLTRYLVISILNAPSKWRFLVIDFLK